jgi:hypothetical protein
LSPGQPGRSDRQSARAIAVGERDGTASNPDGINVVALPGTTMTLDPAREKVERVVYRS